MGVIFRDPWWLALVLLAIPLGWMGLRLFRAMSRARAISAVVIRGALIALIASALAGAASVRTSDRIAVIAVVDVSGSVRRFGDFAPDASGKPMTFVKAVRGWLERAAGDRAKEDLLGVVIFDGDSLALATPAPPTSRAGADSGAGWTIEDLPLDLSLAEGTDIGAALRFASALFPPGARRRLALISDGDQTRGDALAEARSLAGGAGESSSLGGAIPVDVLPIAYHVRNEVMVEFVDAPPTAPRDAMITVRVGVYATRAMTGTLRLEREGEELDINGDAPGSGRRIALEPGRQVVPIQIRVPDQTVHRFRAFFAPDDPTMDTVAQNNAGEAFTVTPGKGRILVIDGVSGGATTGPGSILPATLTRAGLEVDTIPPSAAPTDALSLQEYDLVILQNVPADAMPRGAQELYASYVRDLGGGLVMVGGPNSFGAGGWNGGAIEDVLPVEMDLPENLIVPSAAIVIVMDSSGSMANRVLGGSRTQQEIADEAAALAVMTLDPQDLVGVIEFDSSHRTIIPLGPNRDAAGSARKIRAISPGGGTNLYPALAEAGAMLRGVDAQVKLIIALTDGVSMGSPMYGQNLAGQLAGEGIRVSTIAVGDGADTATLQGIALAGGGQYYRVIDPNLLPQIFIREVRVVRKPMVRETVFQPWIAPVGSPITAGLPDPLPTLGGLVLTQPRTSVTAINAIVAPGGEPVLAHWNIGLGSAAAWTSDTSRWARAWIGSPAFEILWTQIARVISRPETNQHYDLVAEARNGRLRVRLDAADDDGRPMDLLTVPGFVYSPSGKKTRLTLEQTGPGVYEGATDADETGAYVVALTPRQGNHRLPPVVAGAASAISPEYSRLQSNIGLLRRIAETTGGRVLGWEAPELAGLFDRADLAPRRALTPLWPLLLAWGVGVMLVDVGARRVAWDRLLSRELAAALAQHADDSTRGAHAAATLGRLRGRSRRVRASHGRRRGSASPSTPPAQRDQEPAPFTDRRRAIREALRSDGRPTPGADRYGEPPRAQESDDRGERRSVGPSESLLEAKRRARERFEHEADSP